MVAKKKGISEVMTLALVDFIAQNIFSYIRILTVDFVIMQPGEVVLFLVDKEIYFVISFRSDGYGLSGLKVGLVVVAEVIVLINAGVEDQEMLAYRKVDLRSS